MRRTFVAWMILAVGASVLLSCSVLTEKPIVSTTIPVKEGVMLLTSIETDSELGAWSSENGKVTLSEENATEGSHSLRIDYSGVSPTLTYDTGGVDVSAYEFIKLDITLVGKPITFNTDFFDSEGKRYRVWYYLYQEGSHVIEYYIPGLALMTDTTRLDRIAFVTEGKMAESESTTLYIDNVRLMSGAHDDSWLTPEWEGEPQIVVPGNIIENGDFELGIQGWGSWGEWDGGRYGFGSGKTREFVKSGSSSLSISCVTLGRGGVMIMLPTLEPGEYTLTYWIKANGPGGESFWQLLGDGTPHIVPSTGARFAVPTEWVEVKQVVTMSKDVTNTRLYLFSTGVGTIYIDAVSLVGKTTVSKETSVQTKPRIVTVEKAITYVDGEPFFPIGLYGNDPAALAKDSGFNLICSVGSGDRLTFLDECEKNGIMTWIAMTGLARGHVPHKAAEMIVPFKNHPAVLLWYTCDEPDHAGWMVPPPEIRYMTKRLHEEDPNHPTMGLMMSWATSNFYQYATVIDIFGTDIYFEDVAKCVDKVVECRTAIGPDTPMWIILRAYDDSGSAPEITSSYYYGTTYGAIVESANGIVWFVQAYLEEHPDSKRTIYAISLELKELSPALLSETSSKKVECSNENIRTIMKEYDGNLYLIAVNIGPAASDVKLTVADIAATEAEVKFESRTVSISKGKIKDSFDEYERHVYVFPSTPVIP